MSTISINAEKLIGALQADLAAVSKQRDALIEQLKELKDTCKETVRDGLYWQEIPEHTCPLIDGVVECIKDAQRGIDDAVKRLGHVHDDDAESLARDLLFTDIDCLGRLESIRKANLELRDLGKKWYGISKAMLERVNDAAESAVSDD